MNLLAIGGVALVLAILLTAKSKEEVSDKLADGQLGNKKEHKKRNKDNIGLEVGGIVISQENMNNGVWIVGPPGVGKTTKVYTYNLLRKGFQISSKIITDLKGEIYDTTSKYRRSLGEECYLFEPLNTESEFKYNPLEFCNSDEEVMQLAHNILVEDSNSSDRKWQEMAFPLWASVMVWSYHQEKGKNNIPEAIKLLNTMDFEFIEKEVSQYNKSKELYSMFKTVGEAKGTLSSILITLMANIQIYNDKRIQANLKENSFDPKDFKSINANLYIKYDIKDINYLKSFLKVFYGQILGLVCDGKKGNKQVIFLLDELQNLGRIPNFQNYCAYCRGSNVSIIGGTQDLSALKAVYGNYEAMTIVNSLETKIVFPRLTDIEALTYIENLCGETEFTVRENEQEKKYKKHLFSKEQIRTLKDEEAILIIENCNPIKVKLKPWYKDKKLVNNSKNGVDYGEVKWL